jgi:hypothetical protein
MPRALRPNAVLLGLLCFAALLSCTDQPTAPVFLNSSSASSLGLALGGSVSSASAAPAIRMLWQNTSTGDRSIWLMNGTSWDGGYVPLPQVPTEWSIAGSGDFNTDGNTDIVWQNTVTGDRSIWFMSGNTWGGTYAALWPIAPCGHGGLGRPGVREGVRSEHACDAPLGRHRR